MKMLPVGCVLVRTWFGNDDAWQQLKSAVDTPTEDGFLAGVQVVEDPSFAGLDADAMKASTPADVNGALVSFIADEDTLTSDGWPILAVWVLEADGDDGSEYRPFRVVASELWDVENNLNLANLDWDDFADAVDPDGVFRGFQP